MADKKRSPLGILFLTLFIDLVGFSIIFPLFPHMLDHYFKIEPQGGVFDRLISFLNYLSPGSGENQTKILFGGVLGSIYSLLQFLFAPVWGSLSDRTGRRPVLLFSILGTAASYLLWFFSGSFALLIASRLLGGCMSGNIATASAAVADSTSRESRAKGMGIIGAAFGLGFIAGPALGSFFARWNLAERLPDWTGYGVNPFSAPALAAFFLSVLNLLWVYLRFDETLSLENRDRARESQRSINPLVLFRPANLPGVSATNMAYFIFIVAFSGIEFTLTFFAKDNFGYTAERDMWKIFVYVGVLLALIQGGLVRRLAPRFGERNLSLAGLLFLVPAFFLIGASPPSQGWFYLGLTFMAVGCGLSITCLTSLVSLYTPVDRQGAVLGVFRSLGSLARASGPLLFCILYWKFGQLWPYVCAGVLMLLPGGIASRLEQPRKGEEPEGR
ncbi:MAG: MFS transporter [Planctomycetes bacterium]|nr:MFS transporter [Planctomycetota bacterium]